MNILILGKIWGNPSGKRVLAIHGMQDNCGVFDRLIAMLHGDYYIVVIDLPGHGLSSHFPAGIPIELLNYVLAIHYVVKEIGWKKFVYLGHSLGGHIGLFFTALYPEYVDKLIVIDHISPIFYSENNLVKSLRDHLDQHIALQARIQNGTPPVYTYEEALSKFTNRDSTLTDEAAKIVLKRSLKDTGNGFLFRMDQRLKQPGFALMTIFLIRDVLRNVRCPTLFIFSTERYTYYEKTYGEIFQYMKNKPNVSIEVVAGNHDLHQNHPERIVKFVDDFFLSEKCKL